MQKRTRLPIALTIAGSDSGGGAGIQSDLKTFAALGAHGTSAITCVTAQNPAGVLAIEAISAKVIDAQIEAILTELPPRAAKTGMLYSSAIIEVVAARFQAARIPLIVDPVMVATSGARLLKPAAIKALTQKLFPLAALVTPNAQETELLAGFPLRTEEDSRRAARTIFEQHGCAALIKGGHLAGAKEAIDIFYDGKTELMLSAPFVRGVKTHGTGCAYSSAIAGLLALGRDLPAAVSEAKEFVFQAIAQTQQIARHQALHWFHQPR